MIQRIYVLTVSVNFMYKTLTLQTAVQTSHDTQKHTHNQQGEYEVNVRNENGEIQYTSNYSWMNVTCFS